MSSDYDIIVIGGGHAGVEAAWAAARLGARTALVSLSIDTIGQMSCNPAIGGVGKGQMVREIDALGGLMGLAADATGIQFRMLNASKGPAVHGPRCQSDRHAYARWVQQALQACPNLTLIEGEATEIVIGDGCVKGVRIADAKIMNYEFGVMNEDTVGDSSGLNAADSQLPPASLHSEFRIHNSGFLTASAVIVAAGTFLNGVMHLGEETWQGGRIHEPSATTLSDSLRAAGLKIDRLKTGTCPRIDAATINYDRCSRQDGDDPPQPFSFLNDRIPQTQIPCWLTATNEDIHDVVRENFHRAPLYTGQIQSVGPRYCPSFETKVERFPDKTSHQVFLEPEGRQTNWVYCNGISTSLPRDVQKFMVNHIPGLEKAIILQYGYAIEYDFVQPTQVTSTLETKTTRGLYLTGQILGTTGYEEAAALGLMAAVNAVRAIRDEEPFLLRRDQAYIGVMIDDLVTKGVTEPYRMFTSRAEHRLLLRADNADRRLTPIGRELGLVDDDRWNRYSAKADAIEQARQLMHDIRIDGKSIWELLRRPDVDLRQLLAPVRGKPADLTRGDGAMLTNLRRLADEQPQAVRSLSIDAAYAGYLEKQAQQVSQLRDLDAKKIPADLNYAAITQLRYEAREKLGRIRPANLGQALRVSGITPADVTVLAIHLATR